MFQVAWLRVTVRGVWARERGRSGLEGAHLWSRRAICFCDDLRCSNSCTLTSTSASSSTRGVRPTYTCTRHLECTTLQTAAFAPRL